MKALEKIGVGVLASPFVVLMLIVAYAIVALWTWCASLIWAWHVVPIWPALPLLTWKQLWAIAAVKGLVFGKAVDFKDEKQVEGWELAGRFAAAVVAPFVILFFAWWIR